MKKAFILWIILSLLLLRAFSQNVGFGTNSPNAKIDVAGDIALREGTAISAPPLGGNFVISLNATGPDNSFYRLIGAPSATFNLAGIANGTDGELITLINATTGGQQFVIRNSNTGTADIQTGSGNDITIPSGGSVTLMYSAGSVNRWYVTSTVNDLGNNEWHNSGNTGTVPPTGIVGTTISKAENFMGTADANDFAIGTNQIERLRILSSGNVGIGNATPAVKLDVAGSVKADAGILVNNGTMSTPAIRFINDANSGIFRPATNTIGFVVANVEKARFTSSGLQLGVGSWNAGNLSFANGTNNNTVSITSGVTSTSYSLTLPTTQSGTGQFLKNDGSGNLSWGDAGGVSSVTGTSPLSVTNTTTTPGITLSGTSGGVIYGTGTGSAFTPAGNVSNLPGTPAQVLVSQGASAPAFTTLGGGVCPFYTGLVYSGGYANIQYATGTTLYYGSPGNAYNSAGESLTQIKMPKCIITRLRVIPNANTLNGNSTITLRKNASDQSLAVTIPNATAGIQEGTGNILFNDGDLLSIKGVYGGTSGNLSIYRIEFSYYLLP